LLLVVVVGAFVAVFEATLNRLWGRAEPQECKILIMRSPSAVQIQALVSSWTGRNPDVVELSSVIVGGVCV
jgi:hypothetical protein